MSPDSQAADRILDAAAALFAERGYAATSTRAIADAAGVNEVTVFRRFESKIGVLRALVERMAKMTAGLAAASTPPSDDVRETLLHFARLEIRGAVLSGGLAMRMAYDAQSVPEIRELMGEALPGNLEALSEYFAEHQAAGDLRSDLDAKVMAEAFFSLTSSYVIGRTVLGIGGVAEDIDTDTSIEQLFELFWSGARPDQTSVGE